VTISKSPRLKKLYKQLDDPKFRHGYLTHSIKSFLAAQIRALRSDEPQIEFGKRIGKPQSVVSRLENQGTSVNVQTLIEIANKLDLGLIVRFVDYPTFLNVTDDFSEDAFAPKKFSELDFASETVTTSSGPDAVGIIKPAPSNGYVDQRTVKTGDDHRGPTNVTEQAA